MTTDVAVIGANALSVHDLKGRHDRIQTVLKTIMKKDIDYGRIPGCGEKPGLLKSGAEKILSTFELAVRIESEHITDLSDYTKVRYRIISPIVHIHTGLVVGHGVGECSSGEEKYAWKAAVCDEEWNETDPANRRCKWKKGRQGSKNYQVKQIRTMPDDMANTVLKMAKKRSVVDGTLTSTGASDMFEQGEDMTGDDEDGFNRGGQQEQPEKPKPGTPLMPGYAGKYANKPISEMSLDTLQEFLPGIKKSIDNPTQAKWRQRNIDLAAAMESRIAELMPRELISSLDVVTRLQASQSMTELTETMNAAMAHKSAYSSTDWETIQNVFDHAKKALQAAK